MTLVAKTSARLDNLSKKFEEVSRILKESPRSLPNIKTFEELRFLKDESIDLTSVILKLKGKFEEKDPISGIPRYGAQTQHKILDLETRCGLLYHEVSELLLLTDELYSNLEVNNAADKSESSCVAAQNEVYDKEVNCTPEVPQNQSNDREQEEISSKANIIRDKKHQRNILAKEKLQRVCRKRLMRTFI